MGMVRVLLRGSWRLVVLAIAAGIVSGLAGAAVLSVLPAGDGKAPSLLHGLSFLALAALTVTSKVLSEVLLTQLAQRTIADIRTQLSRQIMEAPFARVEEMGAHRLLAALHDDATIVTQAYVYLPLLCVNVATVVGCLAYLGFLSLTVLAVVLAAMMMGALVFRAYERRALRFFGRARETNDALFRHFRALTAGIKELKMNHERGDTFLTRALVPSLREHQQHFVRGMTLYSLATGWGTLLFYGALGVTVFVLPHAAALDARAVTGSTLALLYLLGPFAMVIEVLPALGRAEVALRKWQELGLTLAVEFGGTAGAVPPSAPIRAVEREPRSFRRIELVDVTMRYRREHEDETFRLGPLSLTLGPGEVVFLTGGNGSGKTTLTLLLLGLYAPESGSVVLDGVPVDDATRADFRQLFSVVFADYHVFDALLDLSAPEAADRARHYVSRLRLERCVRVEHGGLTVGGLSQGQRKRLALLIAALEDRPIYVFDEWAADQDPLFRKVFYTEILPELRANGKAVLVVSHDDQYFDLADRRVRMDFGRLSETPNKPLAHAREQSLAQG